MVNYYVISKNEKAVGQGGETLYGVCACTLHDGVMLWKCRTASTAYPVIWPG